MKARKAVRPPRPWSVVRRRLRPWQVALLVLGTQVSLPAAALEGKFNPRDPLGYSKKRASADVALAIEVAPGDWGNASVRDIQVVLDAVGREFLSYVASPRAGDIAIRVIPRAGSPKVLYEQGRDGEYVIQLTVRDDRWYQYAYQFAHELCHVFSNFDHKDRLDNQVPEYNQWFEESLCETASLFTLRQLAGKWATNPPMKNWVGYDQLMSGYARRLIAEPHRYLAADRTFQAWFAEHQAALRNNPYLREKNELVATALLPLFEAHPEYWQAIKYLNPQVTSAAKTFAGYLMDWLAAAPDKRLPREVLTLFGLGDSSVVAEALRAEPPARQEMPAAPPPPAGAVGGPAGPTGG